MKTVEKKYLLPFCLVTVLFLLWGIANNMTDTLLYARGVVYNSVDKNS